MCYKVFQRMLPVVLKLFTSGRNEVIWVSKSEIGFDREDGRAGID